MSQRGLRNLAASVRQRLFNLARERGEDFQLLLTRYAAERLLYRLSRSPYSGQFVLKGATLFTLWGGGLYRATRDLDLLGSGRSDLPRLEQIFRDLCKANVEDDGIRFAEDTVRAEEIRENQEYGGIRVVLAAHLGTARVQLQVDVGFGDVITPPPKDVEFPTILDFPAPRLKAYPRETVVAEKFQAIVMLGIANSRMRDFYDLWVLSMRFSFDGKILGKAIRKTFARRRTAVPAATPLALTAEFYNRPDKNTQWVAFLRRAALESDVTTLPQVAGSLEKFLMPPSLALSKSERFEMIWPPAGPWR